MNIDFIEAIGIFSDKDTEFLSRLQYANDDKKTGYKTYEINGCTPFKILHNATSGIIKIRGSVMYFIQGHNFTYDNESFVYAIEFIANTLHIDSYKLWEMDVHEIECGVIIKVDRTPREYIQHHREGKGMLLYESPKDKGHFRSFNNKLAKRKMYDASRNIKQKQPLKMRDILKGLGWTTEGNFLKWEVHYISPEKTLNNGEIIRLCDLMSAEWQERINLDILKQYKAIMPMKSIEPPIDAKHYYTQDIIMRELVMRYINDGRTKDEIKKILYSSINNSDVLTEANKNQRKRQIKATLDAIKESENSIYDLTEALTNGLNLSDPDKTSTL